MSNERIERVIVLGERLIAALEADIAALEKGKPQAMKTIDPEIQKVAALYAREASGLNAGMAQAASAELRGKLTATTTRFRDTLQRQGRILTRVRNASEGIVQAVAREVERRRTVTTTYGRKAVPARAASAMIFNAVT